MKKSNRSFGKVRLKFQGLNVEKFINFILQENFNVSKVKREESNIFSLIVLAKNSQVLIEKGEKFGFKVSIEERFGLCKFTDFIFRRFSFVLTFLIVLCVYIFSNLFLWQINLAGNIRLKNDEILAVLRQNDISLGLIKNKINTNNIEKLLLSNFEEIALVSVNLYGNSLNINISEKLEKDFLTYSPILSQFNGVVKDFTLISGTAAVKVGDLVRAGDILVYPYIIDNSGQKKSISGKANILLEVDFIETISYNENREIYKDTGNVFKSSNISLFKLNFRKNKACPFKFYRKEVKTYYVLNNNFLPIKKEITTYYEQIPTLQKLPFETCEAQVVDDAYRQVLKKASAYNIIDSRHDIVKVNNIYYITISVKAMVEIGGLI